ncbi:hypothetical protein ABDI30_07910 [Paenibacillus cisolokensis]|uniref:hypothetical protein n=1 Tax=Paenibacillus cisolokensis TaxID=1658519 RepID=UPI003D2865CC
MRQSPKFTMWQSLAAGGWSGGMRETSSLARLTSGPVSPDRDIMQKGSTRQSLPRS